jgi:hypothetical protein
MPADDADMAHELRVFLVKIRAFLFQLQNEFPQMNFNFSSLKK